MVQVKICGITSLEDAELCIDAGADAIGLNFWAGSPRCVDCDTARTIVQAFGSAIEVVGVFVDAPLEAIEAARSELGFSWVQLHGSEDPEVVRALLPKAYKALGVADSSAIEEARRYPGERLLLDARVPGAMPGGTGKTFDWAIAAEIAEERQLTLAGGLTPDNVVNAVRQVHPVRVDVASGVERGPGKKEPALVRAFVTAAKNVNQ